MNKQKFLSVFLSAVLLVGISACTKPEEDFGLKEFTIGEEGFLVEQWLRVPEFDTEETDCYGLCILQKSGSVRIALSGPEPKNVLSSTVKLGKTVYDSEGVYHEAIQDIEGYALRYLFPFNLPKGAELPSKGTLIEDGVGEQIMDLRELTVFDNESAK